MLSFTCGLPGLPQRRPRTGPSGWGGGRCDSVRPQGAGLGQDCPPLVPASGSPCLVPVPLCLSVPTVGVGASPRRLLFTGAPVTGFRARSNPAWPPLNELPYFAVHKRTSFAEFVRGKQGCASHAGSTNSAIHVNVLNSFIDACELEMLHKITYTIVCLKYLYKLL